MNVNSMLRGRRLLNSRRGFFGDRTVVLSYCIGSRDCGDSSLTPIIGPRKEAFMGSHGFTVAAANVAAVSVGLSPPILRTGLPLGATART